GQMATTVGLLAGGALGAAIGVRPLFLLAAVGAAGTALLIFLPHRSTLKRTSVETVTGGSA
ncbi:MAG: hypothetical protein ACYC33_09015, partial [Thermoleophilia bacterium]